MSVEEDAARRVGSCERAPDNQDYEIITAGGFSNRKSLG